MKMLIKKTIAAVTLTLMGAWGNAQASSITFDSAGDASTLYFVLSHDGASLNTSIDFTLTSITANTATFAMRVVNASSGPGGNVFMSFGIDVVSPTLNYADATGMWDAGLNATFAGSQRVDLCVYAANNCAGGAIGQGLAEGGVSTFNLTLKTAGNFTVAGITFLSPYSAKWQNVGTTGRSFETPNGCFGTATCGGTSVPEPGTLALLGLGLLGLGFAARRKTT